MPGDKDKQAPTTSDAVTAQQPAYLNNTSPATMPAFMPGQLEALSKQLSAGFGTTPKAMADMLKQINQPAQTLNFGAKPPAAAPKAAPQTAPKPNAGGDGQVFVNGAWKPVLPGGQVFVNGQWKKVM